MPSDRTAELPQANGWNEYKRLVLAELERLDKSMISIAGKHDEISKSLHISLNQTRDTIVQQLTEFSDQMHKRITAGEARITVLEVRLQRLESDVKAVSDKDLVPGTNDGRNRRYGDHSTYVSRCHPCSAVEVTMSDETEKPVDCVAIKQDECKLCRMHVADSYVAVPKSLLWFGGTLLILTATALLIHAVMEVLQ